MNLWWHQLQYRLFCLRPWGPPWHLKSAAKASLLLISQLISRKLAQVCLHMQQSHFWLKDKHKRSITKFLDQGEKGVPSWCWAVPRSGVATGIIWTLVEAWICYSNFCSSQIGSAAAQNHEIIDKLSWKRSQSHLASLSQSRVICV